MWTITSPDRALALTVRQDDQQRLYYSLQAGDLPIVAPSRLGVATSLGDLLEGYRFIRSEERSIQESYSLPVAKKSVFDYEASELTLHFQVRGLDVSICFRLFRDGLAFRYAFGFEQPEPLRVFQEYTDFVFPQHFEDLWLQSWINTYEGTYDRRDWQSAATGDYGMPALLHSASGGHWVMLTEAGILNTGGSYCSSHLQGAEGRRLKLAFAPEQMGPVSMPLPGTTPWRVVTVCRTLNELVNSHMNYDLNPPCDWEDLSWIKPGRSIWSWWSFENGAQLFSEQKKYVDFAAAMGFEAITVDAGWDDSWVKELCDYARARQVDVWLWSDMQAIDTLEKAEEKIPRWAAWGVVGLKVDFFMNDSQHTMWQYQMIADIMTRCKLMINFHGSTKPAGEGRTYPNIMTAEGILGLEHHKWSGLPHAAHNCTVPFTRNVVGPMDYTVTGFSNANRNTTQAHQLALTVVFESGVQHFADSIYMYEPWTGTEFMRRLPAKFDDLKLLSGFPGDHAVMMRRAGQQWFVGGIVDAGRSLTVPLDFLPVGQYQVELYRDGKNGDLLVKETYRLSNEDSVQVEALTGGGFAMYVSDGTTPLEAGVCGGYMDANFRLYPAEAATLIGSADRVASAHAGAGGAVCLGSRGEALFDAIAADRDGRHTMRLFYSSEEVCSVQVIVNDGQPQLLALDPSGSDRTLRTADLVVALKKGGNTISLRNAGAARSPLIERIKLLDYAPHEDTFYDAAVGELAGGACLCRADGAADVKKAVGIGGGGGSITFPQVAADADGDYILTIDYYSGENRVLMIEVNDRPPMRSVLFNSGGWGPARWDIVGTKEVLVKLRAGDNRIKLHHDDGPAPEIQRIGVRRE